MSFEMDRAEFDGWLAEGPEGVERIWSAYQDALRKSYSAPEKGPPSTIRRIGKNLPFVVTRFNEHMDDVYHDALSRFEGSIRARSEELGLNVLRGDHFSTLALEVKNEDE